LHIFWNPYSCMMHDSFTYLFRCSVIGYIAICRPVFTETGFMRITWILFPESTECLEHRWFNAWGEVFYN